MIYNPFRKCPAGQLPHLSLLYWNKKNHFKIRKWLLKCIFGAGIYCVIKGECLKLLLEAFCRMEFCKHLKRIHAKKN